MPLYMTQVGYTSEAWAALTQNPEDRSEAFGRLAESMGGRLVSTKPPTRALLRPSSWPPSPPDISVASRLPCCSALRKAWRRCARQVRQRIEHRGSSAVE